MRSIQGVRRGEPMRIVIDGREVDGFAGETLAAVMMAQGLVAARTDTRGLPRGLYCNMGTCMECMVSVIQPDGGLRRQRACLTDISPGMQVSTTAASANS